MPQLATGDWLKDRYQIQGILGKGGMGITYGGCDRTTGDAVAIKAVSLRQAQDWKLIELFQREARILTHLDHPQIPRYVDSFEQDDDYDLTFYLVQQQAPGQSLAQWIEQGWRPDWAEVKALASQVLTVLIYLHQLQPPIIHRDLKPQNLLRDDSGQIFLVDFGSVRDCYHHTVTGGTTVVGTYGYMAPEQFRGQAKPATDLYGLGTTLLFLLTGQPPADLPHRGLYFDLQNLSVPPQARQWLERLVEPTLPPRLGDAATALAVLNEQQPLPPKPSPRPRPVEASPIQVQAHIPPDNAASKHLVIHIPPVWRRNAWSFGLTLASLLINGLGLLLIIWLAQSPGGSNLWVQILFTAFLLPLWLGLLLIQSRLPGSNWFMGMCHTRIVVDPKQVRITRSWFKITIRQVTLPRQRVLKWRQRLIKRPGKKSQMGLCELVGQGSSWRPRSQVRYPFGHFLTPQEQAWVVAELQHFCQEP